jgi:hypothetical protein
MPRSEIRKGGATNNEVATVKAVDEAMVGSGFRESLEGVPGVAPVPTRHGGGLWVMTEVVGYRRTIEWSVRDIRLDRVGNEDKGSQVRCSIEIREGRGRLGEVAGARWPQLLSS